MVNVIVSIQLQHHQPPFNLPTTIENAHHPSTGMFPMWIYTLGRTIPGVGGTRFNIPFPNIIASLTTMIIPLAVSLCASVYVLFFVGFFACPSVVRLFLCACLFFHVVFLFVSIMFFVCLFVCLCFVVCFCDVPSFVCPHVHVEGLVVIKPLWSLSSFVSFVLPSLPFPLKTNA